MPSSNAMPHPDSRNRLTHRMAKFDFSKWGMRAAQVALSEILQELLLQLRDAAEEYKADFERIFKARIDQLVDMDIPGLPDFAEEWLDPQMRTMGYQCVDAILQTFFPERPRAIQPEPPKANKSIDLPPFGEAE